MKKVAQFISYNDLPLVVDHHHCIALCSTSRFRVAMVVIGDLSKLDGRPAASRNLPSYKCRGFVFSRRLLSLRHADVGQIVVHK